MAQWKLSEAEMLKVKASLHVHRVSLSRLNCSHEHPVTAARMENATLAGRVFHSFVCGSEFGVGGGKKGGT